MTAVLRLKGIGVTYPGPPPVCALQSVDLTVEPAEHLSIVGPSGSGKSTLLNVIGLLDRPTTGSYELDGVDTSQLGEADRAALRGSRIGFVFQAFHLLAHRTALENVALAQLYTGPPAAARREAARVALDQVGLTHRSMALPTQLSGGERQRVAIARALVNEPALLLCDEPTGNLDSGTADAVLALLDAVRDKGFTIITITHDPLVARRGTRTVTIRDGKLQ
ncbi:putative ABC transport system ATP-binding protein [Hamadaea flava]|uniref:ABC transporter ATP-binding protein n=1 Tax=Hamadaea flava TaxID=1742688 RepID=A0ABV8LZH6_9ACTN|nr:ABC transporter ATP-binding protein [Hamadaea flava]MCP2327015.1 putative ABC transport system ATP-binding protein [Hamadaea flava]